MATAGQVIHGRDDHRLAELHCYLVQGRQPRRVEAIVIGQQQFHRPIPILD